MNIDIDIFTGPLPPASPWRIEHAGAVVRFEGVVRPMENQRRIIALDYETYPPMTRNELETLAHAMLTRHDLLAIRVRHSHGLVPVGRCSFQLDIAASHRKAALAAMEEFIDRMKRDVPIWKLPVWAHG